MANCYYYFKYPHLCSFESSNCKSRISIRLFYGLGWFATGISWIHVAIADFGGMPTAISILLMALLDGYLALFPALACYLTKRFYISNIGFAFIPFWLICEAIRGWFLTGFPDYQLVIRRQMGHSLVMHQSLGNLGSKRFCS
ncbi:hypothetical protein [Psychrosphaera algicola]|uniref:hypothetical protein n=1 Tax=Psychrosphaera algicola TaxID=3023714 RepID=UPI002FEE570D